MLRSSFARRAASWLTARYIQLCFRTGRWEVRGGEWPEAFWRRQEPFILAFWHGRLLMMPCIWQTGTPIHMLVSQHRDGEMMARAIRAFGVQAVRGSGRRAGKRGKGGAAAFRLMLKLLKEGSSVAITPDGPRGPRMHAGEGVVAVARLSGAAILPAACSSSPRILLNSWDRFSVPLPFCRGVFVWDRPIQVAREADEAALEAARRQVETALLQVTAEADRLVGQTPVEPAPLTEAGVR